MTCESLGADVHRLADAPLPPAARRAAERTLLNVCATAIAASRHPVVEALVDLALTHGGTPAVPLPGRRERTDRYHAALVSGTAAQLLDYDDTQLSTVLHPGAAPFGALVAVAGSRNVAGEKALAAYALGCEVAMRVALAISPSHYGAGWHITGTCGVIGAAVTAALLLDADAEQLAHAIGIAASETVGHREAFGTGSKTLHGGKAAANGFIAAALATRGFTGSASLDTPRGFFTVFAADGPVVPECVQDGLGTTWELTTNTFKPYPCGIVAHPAIDAALALHAQGVARERIRTVTVRVHPLVVELMNVTQPSDGLQAIFSAAHGVAVALLDGAAGMAQYADGRVTAPDVAALRERVTFEIDGALAADAAAVEIALDDGAIHRVEIPHARGSVARPLTDTELEAKARALVEPILPGRCDAVHAAVYALGDGGDTTALLDAIRAGVGTA